MALGSTDQISHKHKPRLVVLGRMGQSGLGDQPITFHTNKILMSATRRTNHETVITVIHVYLNVKCTINDHAGTSKMETMPVPHSMKK